MELNLSVVRSFVVVSTTLSFTKAAFQLQVTQPQLSVRIRNLESQLGFRLFDRSSRRVRLTAQGEKLLPTARRLVDLAEQLSHEAGDIRLGGATSLHVGATLYFEDIRRRLLARFMKRHPALRVEVERAKHYRDFAEDILSGRFDVAFVTSPADRPPSDELETVVLDRHPIGLLLPEHSPLARKTLLDPRDLRGLRAALFRAEDSPEFHGQIADRFAPLGIGFVGLPEASEQGLVDFVRETGVPAICARWWEAAADPPPDVTHRCVEGMSWDLLCLLVRRRGSASPQCNALWRMAQSAARERAPVVAA